MFYRPEAVHLGDLLRIWVRPGTRIRPSPSDFQGPAGAHRTPQEPRCFTGLRPLSPGEPIPGCPPLTKKRELFPGPPPTSPSSFASPHRPHEAAISVLGFGNIDPIPFRGGKGAKRDAPASERNSPISQDRLTHVQLLFTWNPSPLRPSRFSLEYLLLPPRSAPAAAPRGLAPGASALTAAALLLAAA